MYHILTHLSIGKPCFGMCQNTPNMCQKRPFIFQKRPNKCDILTLITSSEPSELTHRKALFWYKSKKETNTHMCQYVIHITKTWYVSHIDTYEYWKALFWYVSEQNTPDMCQKRPNMCQKRPNMCHILTHLSSSRPPEEVSFDILGFSWHTPNQGIPLFFSFFHTKGFPKFQFRGFGGGNRCQYVTLMMSLLTYIRSHLIGKRPKTRHSNTIEMSCFGVLQKRPNMYHILTLIRIGKPCFGMCQKRANMCHIWTHLTSSRPPKKLFFWHI